MLDKSREILAALAQHPKANSGAEFRYSKDPAEKAIELKAESELVECGYIKVIQSAVSFAVYSITSSGKSAAQNL